MLSNSRIEQRNERPYVAVRTVVAMPDIGTAVPPLIPQVYAWLQQRGEAPAGPLFFRYIRMDEGKRMDVEVAVPVATELEGEGDVVVGALPAGRYAVALYRGPYEGLPKAWSAFENWREEIGVPERGEVTQDGVIRGTRTEHYLVGPNESDDPVQWETELALYAGSETESPAGATAPTFVI